MIPDRLVAAFPEHLGLQSPHVRPQESIYFRKNIPFSRQFLYASFSFLCPGGGSFCGTVFNISFRFWSLSKGITVQSLLWAGDWPYSGRKTILVSVFLCFDGFRAEGEGSEGPFFGGEKSTSACLRRAREGLAWRFFFSTGCISIAPSSSGFAEPWLFVGAGFAVVVCLDFRVDASGVEPGATIRASSSSSDWPASFAGGGAVFFFVGWGLRGREEDAFGLVARCLGGAVDGTGEGLEAGLSGECGYVIRVATSSAVFTAVELASGSTGDWGGGTRPSTCSGFIMTEPKLRTSLFADFSNFDNLNNSKVNCSLATAWYLVE